jgi:FMN phosphatase YigB (HAD superfamily)
MRDAVTALYARRHNFRQPNFRGITLFGKFKKMTIKVIFFDIGETLITKDKNWVEGAKAALTEMQTSGLLLGIISNTAAMKRADVIKQRLPADFDFSIFEESLVILSSEVGFEKPDVKIFELAVAQSKVSEEECLFCTENPVDTLAAQRTGLRAIRLLPPPESDINKLEEYLAKVRLIT